MEYVKNTEEKHIFALVGLPARGKSYLSKKIAVYLNWIGYTCKVFSVGVYRRTILRENFHSKFFEENEQLLREKCIKRAIDDLVEFLFTKGGKVAIVDGTNTRSNRRRMIEEYLKSKVDGESKVKIIWIEAICNLDYIVEQNILKTKLRSPDYQTWDKEDAVMDFKQRIQIYEKVYESLSPDIDGEDAEYIQMINNNSEVVIRNLKGFISSKVLSLLVNLYPADKPIYFSRHGESEFNVKKLIGGDSNLTEKGVKYSKALCNFFQEHEKEWLNKSYFTDNCVIFCSTFQRCLQTAEELKNLGTIVPFKCLEELNAGLYDGMSYSEIREKYEKDYNDRESDKLNYRYPRGESYMDLIHRIEPVIHELERRNGPVIVIGHQATLRCLYGYFTQVPIEKIPYLEVPLHTVIKYVPEAFGYHEEIFEINPDEGTYKCNTVGDTFRFEDSMYNVPTEKII